MWDVEQLVGEVEVTAARHFAAGDQDGVERGQPQAFGEECVGWGANASTRPQRDT